MSFTLQKARTGRSLIIQNAWITEQLNFRQPIFNSFHACYNFPWSTEQRTETNLIPVNLYWQNYDDWESTMLLFTRLMLQSSNGTNIQRVWVFPQINTPRRHDRVTLLIQACLLCVKWQNIYITKEHASTWETRLKLSQKASTCQEHGGLQHLPFSLICLFFS